MHEHLVRFRFPNLVAGFDAGIYSKLKGLENEALKRPKPLVQHAARSVFKRALKYLMLRR